MILRLPLDFEDSLKSFHGLKRKRYTHTRRCRQGYALEIIVVRPGEHESPKDIQTCIYAFLLPRMRFAQSERIIVMSLLLLC